MAVKIEINCRDCIPDIHQLQLIPTLENIGTKYKMLTISKFVVEYPVEAQYDPNNLKEEIIKDLESHSQTSSGNGATLPSEKMELEVTDPQNKQTVSPQNSSIGKLSQQVHVVVNCHGGSLEPSKSSLNWMKATNTTNEGHHDHDPEQVEQPEHNPEQVEQPDHKEDFKIGHNSEQVTDSSYPTRIMEPPPAPKEKPVQNNLCSAWINMLHKYFHPSSTHITEKQSKDFTEKLHNFEQCSCPFKGNDLCKTCYEFWPYVENHLKDIECKENVCALWKLCLRKRQYGIFDFAPKRMIIFSHDEDKIGTITYDYDEYNVKPKIGMGGFGRVFQHSVNTKCIAVKEERKKYSLIRDMRRFTNVKGLNNPNVLRFKEYIVGPHRDERNEIMLLLVMEHYDKRGLNEPFRDKTNNCLLDYMSRKSDHTKYIFRNLLVISVHLFKALEYFAGKGLVHKDVKRSNILLKLNCHCSQSAIECTCDGMGGVTALLSDFDLVEEATSDDEWDRLGDTEPAGTRGMIAPELFFVNKNGKEAFTAKADVWSAFLTIMHVLLGRDVNIEPLTKTTKFFQDASSGVYNSLEKISSCIKNLEKHCEKCDTKDNIITENINVLKSVQTSIEQLCKFQGKRQQSGKTSRRKRKDYCPAAEVLTSIHGVTTMPQTCVNKVQHVFQSENALQDSIRELWDIIQEGMCFHPKDRPDAKKVVVQFSDCLEKFLKSGFFD